MISPRAVIPSDLACLVKESRRAVGSGKLIRELGTAGLVCFCGIWLLDYLKVILRSRNFYAMMEVNLMTDFLIIAGSRSLQPTIAQLSTLITTLPDVVVCGCANGADRAGYRWARANDIPVEFFPAWTPQWEWAVSGARDEVVHPLPLMSGRSAGVFRNGEMSGIASRVLILWDGVSRGSKNMRDTALRAGLPCEVHKFIIKDNICVSA